MPFVDPARGSVCFHSSNTFNIEENIMKHLSVLLFTVVFIALLASMAALVVGIEVTRTGAFVVGGLFAFSGLLIGLTHFKNNLRWTIKPLVVSAALSVILGLLTFIGITPAVTLSLLVSDLTVGWGLFSLLSNWS